MPFLSRSPSALSFSESAFPFSPFTDAYAARIRFAVASSLSRYSLESFAHSSARSGVAVQSVHIGQLRRRLFKIVFREIGWAEASLLRQSAARSVSPLSR